MKTIKILLILLIFTLLSPVSALAQSYSFEIPEATVDVFWNDDGTMTLNYEWLFANRSGAAPIDYIDMGLPSEDYDLSSITAEVDGQPISDIQASPYVKPGVALGLGANAIQPGQTGRVRAIVPVVRALFFKDDSQDGYISAQFAPSWFDSQFVEGNTDLTVVFHLPPGVQNQEPRWHSSPSGFPDQPESALDAENRIIYKWNNPNANSHTKYVFGASFPAQYVPGWTASSAPPSSTGSTAVGNTDIVSSTMGLFSACVSFLPALICFGIVGLMIWTGINSGRRRKLQYLPPKVSIEGHGIKRGLTAIEAAILMEQPVDKIMTMILFSVIKKGAASVTSRDPLKINVTVPAPEGLYDYEKYFLEAFSLVSDRERRVKLQETLVKLINSVAEKMKGFSRKETVAYYKQIIENAWGQVEAADTPEVKSEKYNEYMDWTMLDHDYDDRTRRTFGGGPIFVPVWWPHYDPTFPRPTVSGPVPVSPGGSMPGGTGTGVSLPHLPGSDFAASVVGGVQSFSAGVLGNLSEFTGGVTSKTNPLPPPSKSSTTWRGSSSGGTHCACACACACAGCACACAGGGR